MGTRQRVVAIMLVGVIGRPFGASADTPPVRIAYAAADGCPAAARFAAAVLARGRTVVVVDDAAPSGMRVAIAADPRGGYLGSLHTGPPEDGAREVHGTTCPDVVDALAIVTVSSLAPADTIGASATSAGRPVNVATPRETRAESPIPPGPATAPVHPRAGNVSAAPDEVAVEAGTLSFGRDTAMTAFAGLQTGIVPSGAMPRLDFEVTRTNLVTLPDGHRYRVWPTVRLHGSLFLDQTYHSSHGETGVNGLGGGADLCAPLYYDQTGFQMLLCAEVTVNVFGVKTTNAQGGEGPTTLSGLGTAGFGLDVTYNIGRHFNIGLKAGGAAVIGTLTARAGDGSQIFQSSPFSLHAMLGAGGHF